MENNLPVAPTATFGEVVKNPATWLMMGAWTLILGLIWYFVQANTTLNESTTADKNQQIKELRMDNAKKEAKIENLYLYIMTLQDAKVSATKIIKDSTHDSIK